MKKLMFLLLISCVSMVTLAQNISGKSNPVSVSYATEEKAAPEITAPTISLASLGITKLPRYHALVIGVSEYQHAGPGLQNLELPARDAERLSEILIQKYAFAPEDVRFLKNPTREEIINQF